MDNLSDERLVDRLRAGDRHAFGLIYGRYKGRLYTFCVRLIGDESSARDAVHETFLKLFNNAAGIEKGGALKTWLFRTARNEALLFLRRSARQVELEDDCLWLDETPLTILDRSEDVFVVQNVLRDLKAEYREVLLLREYDLMSYEQIAQVTHSTESAVKSRLFKARRALATRLAPWFSERSEG